MNRFTRRGWQGAWAAWAVAALLTAAPARGQAPPEVSAGQGSCRADVAADFESARPAEVGLSSWWLNRLLHDLDHLKYDVRALLVMRDCKVVLERYRDGLGRRNNHIVNSITKSITATLVGRLLHSGSLAGLDVSLGELITRPPGIRDADWDKASRITLRQAMTMSSGLTHDFQPGTAPFYQAGIDRLAASLEPEFVAPPGTRFNYSDGDAFLVGMVVASLAKTDLYAYAKAALFEPLGIFNTDWLDADRRGRYPGGYGVRMRPMDLLKLGQLHVQDGVWNGRRLLPPGFARQAWTPGVASDYGLLWWIRAKPFAAGIASYEARGWKGQRIYVMPDNRTVVALNSSLPRAEEREVDRIILSMMEQAIRDGQNSSEASDAELAQRMRSGFKGETRVNQLQQDRPSFF